LELFSLPSKSDFQITRLQLIKMIDELFSHRVAKNHHEKLFRKPLFINIHLFRFAKQLRIHGYLTAIPALPPVIVFFIISTVSSEIRQ